MSRRKLPLLTENDPMPNGVHAGVLMRDLPGRYLKRLHGRNCLPEVRVYIDNYWRQVKEGLIPHPILNVLMPSSRTVVSDLTGLQQMLHRSYAEGDGVVRDRRVTRNIASLQVAIDTILDAP